MPKPLKTLRASTSDHEGVFGQGGKRYASDSTLASPPTTRRHYPCSSWRCGDYAEKRGWAVAVEVQDVGEASRRRELDCVLVWRLDRWGRSLVDLVNTLQELNALDVGFVSLSEALDLTTPSGRALAGMLAVFAEFERDILRDRVKAGIDQAKKEGKPHGRPLTAGKLVGEMKQLRLGSVSGQSPSASGSVAPQ